MAKNDNMLVILWMLNSGVKMTAKQIAEKLEINIRTVYRYIDALCASGVPIISDPGHNGGYSLLNNFIRAPLLFDMEEKKALLQAAVIACCPQNQFQRFFSYITEITLTKYIRRRRLTLSAFELQKGKLKVIDVALIYGYDSHASFTRAFRDFHGISPTKARNKRTVFNIYPNHFHTKNQWICFLERMVQMTSILSSRAMWSVWF